MTRLFLPDCLKPSALSAAAIFLAATTSSDGWEAKALPEKTDYKITTAREQDSRTYNAKQAPKLFESIRKVAEIGGMQRTLPCPRMERRLSFICMGESPWFGSPPILPGFSYLNAVE